MAHVAADTDEGSGDTLDSARSATRVMSSRVPSVPSPRAASGACALTRRVVRAPRRGPPARAALAALFEISQLLETGLDKETLAILVALCEQGVNPEALAAVVKELRREAAALRVAVGELDPTAEPPVFA